MRKTDQTPVESTRTKERVFREDERWFVRTREGLRGPFGSQRAAEAEADLFVDTVKILEQLSGAWPDPAANDDGSESGGDRR